MGFIKKLVVVKNNLGLIAIGIVFTVIGGIVTFGPANDGSFLPLIFMMIGIALTAVGIIQTMKALKTPAKEYKQYDRVNMDNAPTAMDYDPDETEEDFVFHFTGKANQSYVMKDSDGTPVYEAECGGITLFKDTPFEFRNLLSGEQESKMIGHTVSYSVGDSFVGANISSSFNVDGVSVWDAIASSGYNFKMSLNGIAAHFDVEHWGHYAGFAELGGTGLINPKYANNPLGKVPTNGIFKIRCRKSDIPGLFMICFAITKTEITIE